MKIWIAGTVEQVIKVAAEGVASRIVTNPTVAAEWTQHARQPLETIALQVANTTNVPVYIQLHGPSTARFVAEAESLISLSPLLYPKIPSTHEGIAATNILARRGIKVLVTTVCSLNQAYLSAVAGAESICPYFARLEESGVDAGNFIRSVFEMYRRHSVYTTIMPASIRTAAQAEEALESGASGLIIFDGLFRSLCGHPVTESSLVGFERDWDRTFYKMENRLPN